MASAEAAAGSFAPLSGKDVANLPAVGGRVVQFSGEIVRGDYDRFERATKIRPDLIVLDSSGGSIAEAMKIGEAIRLAGYDTFVRSDQECASACMVIFLSGRTRTVHSGARLGLHAARHDDFDEKVSVPGTAAMAAVLGQLGVPVEVIIRMAETSPSEMWWLDEAQHSLLGIEILPLAPAVPPRAVRGAAPLTPTIQLSPVSIGQ